MNSEKGISRRGFIACGALAALSGRHVLSSPVRSLVGANHHHMTEEDDMSVSAADYVQNGLVAMYDGIENAGWGMHDPDAASWMDLVGLNNGTLATYSHWESDGYVIDNNGTYKDSGKTALRNLDGLVTTVFRADSNWTFEVCYRLMGGIADTPLSRFFRLYGSSNTAYLWHWNNAKVLSAYFGSANPVIDVPGAEEGMTIAATHSANGGVVLVANGAVLYHTSHVPPSASKFFIGANAHSCMFHAIRFYSRALSASEMSASFAIDKRRFGI